jgi:hypothetical protein
MKESALSSSGYQLIEDFITPAECDNLLKRISNFRNQHDLPEIYRPEKHRSLRYSVIDGDQIEKHLPEISTLYQGPVKQLVNQLTGEQYEQLENTRVGANVNIMPPIRSEYRWHYDRIKITAILYLNAVEGGETELYPNYRILLENGNYPQIQQFLDKLINIKIIRDIFSKKNTVTPHPGRLVIMRGNKCWHSVRSVQGSQDRINVVLAYDVPGAQFPMEESLDKYLYTQNKQTSSDPNYG